MLDSVSSTRQAGQDRRQVAPELQVCLRLMHVRWYLLGMGNEVDLHSPHWHGKTVKVGFHRTDTVELLPGSMVTADMRADNPGTWMIHCHGRIISTPGC
jgi:hypothetical protein